jgi:hypothetical protein
MAASESTTEELFEKNRSGRLMKIQDNEFSRYQFEIWFEYTRQSMMNLREGTLLAAKNFATNETGTHFSVLELTSIKPIHYALGNNTDGYPGFVMEAARNISTDWISQESESSEDTTIIQCIASPTEIEIFQNNEGWEPNSDKSIPMIGTEVKVVTAPVTQKIINIGFSNKDNIFEGGKWLVDGKTPILLSVEDLLRVHFGIFGFTKAGKSNLLSTIIAEIIESSENRKIPVKIIILDLMSEYNVLLIDQLDKLKNGKLLAIGKNTFPGSVIEKLEKPDIQNNAVSDFISSSLYPQDLEKNKEQFTPLIDRLFKENKIRLFQDTESNVSSFIEEHENSLLKGNMGASKGVISHLLRNISNDSRKKISLDLLRDIIIAIDQLTECKIEHSLLAGIELPKKGKNVEISPTASSNLKEFKSVLEKKLYDIEHTTPLPADSIMGIFDIISDLNNKISSSLIVVQSHDPDALRMFASHLGNLLFDSRRKKGVTSPLVSFIFDEADEFIPGQFDKDSSYAKSVQVAHMLARRGRKFGIGIGIATQRTRYLNTSIMAQPHTYFVSKLPRLTDRTAVQDAFGFSEEAFRQTFKFTKGDWLLASYDATGLKGVPIPIHAENANDRIVKALGK